MKVAIITASTAVYKGEQEDASGKVIRKMVEEAGLDVVFMKALPTDKTVLSTVFQRMADGNLADLILTTGGAGCGPEDCTPEATMEVVDRPSWNPGRYACTHAYTDKKSYVEPCSGRNPWKGCDCKSSWKSRSCKGMSWIHLARGHACS